MLLYLPLSRRLTIIADSFSVVSHMTVFSLNQHSSRSSDGSRKSLVAMRQLLTNGCCCWEWSGAGDNQKKRAIFMGSCYLFRRGVIREEEGIGVFSKANINSTAALVAVQAN